MKLGDINHSPGGKSDTRSEVRRIQREALSTLSFAERLRLVDDLTRTVQRLARGGLQERFPAASEEELDRRYTELVLGRELAERVIACRRERSLLPPS